MGFSKPKDNKRIKQVPIGPSVDMLYRIPTVYRTFDEIKGWTLLESDGRKLALQKDDATKELYLDGALDVIYLTDKEFADPGVRAQYCTRNGRNPFELIKGKSIDWVDQYAFAFYQSKKLPSQVYVGSYASKLPLEVFLYYDDGVVMIDANPSTRLMEKASAGIMAKDPKVWTDDEIKNMAIMRALWSMQTLAGINVFSPLSQRQFKRRYPDTYQRILSEEKAARKQ